MSKLGEPIYSRKKTTAIWSVSMAVLLIIGCIMMYTVVALIAVLIVFFKTCSDSAPKKFFIIITHCNFFFLITQSNNILSAYERKTDASDVEYICKASAAAELPVKDGVCSVYAALEI